jgi:2'-5' RNA ligase
MPPIFSSFDDAWRWFRDGGQLESMADWRERLTAGRAQLLSFQASVAELPVARAIEALQDELSDVGGLVFFSREMLHISLRGVGFQVIAKTRADDVLRQDVSRIANAAADVAKRTRSIAATVGPVNVFPGALVLEVHDGGAFGELRRALGPIVDDAFGLDESQYLPHITIAMFESPSAADVLRQRLLAQRARPPMPLTVKRIELARWWFTGDDPLAHPERDVVRSYALRG